MSDLSAIGPAVPAPELVPGCGVEVWEQEVFRFRAQVEECAGHLGVVWVREAGIGQRRLVTVGQCRHPAVVDE